MFLTQITNLGEVVFEFDRDMRVEQLKIHGLNRAFEDYNKSVFVDSDDQNMALSLYPGRN